MAAPAYSWSTQSNTLYNDNLTHTLRMSVRASEKFRQFCDPKDKTEMGHGNGDTVHWTIEHPLPEGDRRLTEGTAIPETNGDFTQGTATVWERGISVPFTNLVETFAQHKVTGIVKKQLGRDARETLDREAHGEFKKTHLVYVGTTGTTGPGGEFTIDGTATATNNTPLAKAHVTDIVTLMRERNIPGWNGGDDYACLGRPSTFNPLKEELESVNKYVADGHTKIMKGEVGRYDGCRFATQTLIKAGGVGIGTAQPWVNGQSDEAYFFGDDTVAELICVPEEIRGKIPSDFGRSYGLAWYGIGGFAIVYDDNADPIAMGSPNSRIVRWGSAG